jgi:hypothetical protein
MAGAQASLWLDASVSSARPPAGAPRATTNNFTILGTHGDVLVHGWKLDGAAMVAQSLDRPPRRGLEEQDRGHWAWLQLEAHAPVVTVGGFFFDYREAFHYRLAGGQLQHEFAIGDGELTVRPSLTFARWSTDTLSASFSVAGGTLQWSRVSGAVLYRLTGDFYVTGDNGYAKGGHGALAADLITVVGNYSFGAGASQAVHSRGSDTGFLVWASRSFGDNLRFDLQVSQAVPDAVFGAPGSLGFSATASWRVFSRQPPPPPVLATVGQTVRSGRVVKFQIAVPDSARSVAVSGSFSEWKPIALKKAAGNVWSGTVAIRPGTYQYGFVINGKDWFVPADAIDVVDDGFGRKNVTLVVRGQ